MLSIKIYKVDFGFCALVNLFNKYKILIDSGYCFKNGFMPSVDLIKKNRSIDYLLIPAYHRNHLLSLPYLFNRCSKNGLLPKSLISNPTVIPQDFSEFYKGIRGFEDIQFCIHQNADLGKINQTIKLDGMELNFFWNPYPNFTNVHNLSLVTFLSYQDLHVIFPSNLETNGWLKLLESSQFCCCLQKVNVFVAANHGSEEGYCSDVFNYCNPQFTIISSASGQSVSEEIISQYQCHIRDASIYNNEKRIFITKEDGTIQISKCADMIFEVKTKSSVVGNHLSRTAF